MLNKSTPSLPTPTPPHAPLCQLGRWPQWIYGEFPPFKVVPSTELKEIGARGGGGRSFSPLDFLAP